MRHALLLSIGVGLGITAALFFGPNFADKWTAIGSVGTAVAALIAATALLEQHRAARAENALTAAIELFREWRSADAIDSRKRLYLELPAHRGKAVEDLPEHLRRDFASTSNFADLLGLLVHRELIDYSVVASYLGDALVRLGDALMPFIIEERNRREREGDSRTYQDHFEHLVERLRDEPQAHVLPRSRQVELRERAV